MIINIDRLIIEFDRALRTLAVTPVSARPLPGGTLAEAELSQAEKHHAAGLMRVNHCGEVCAQALYQGQALGYAAGRFGTRWNLGFLAETERQVEMHLEGHLERLAPQDAKTRAIVMQMKQDESAHARTAYALGAVELSEPVKRAMRASARVMTQVSYWV